MTWLLIKKQLMEIFRAYFYNEKKQEKRSMGATIGMFVLFFVLMFLFLGGMFYALREIDTPSACIFAYLPPIFGSRGTRCTPVFE